MRAFETTAIIMLERTILASAPKDLEPGEHRVQIYFDPRTEEELAERRMHILEATVTVHPNGTITCRVPDVFDLGNYQVTIFYEEADPQPMED